MTIFASYLEFINRKKRLTLEQFARRRNPFKVGIKYNLDPTEPRVTGSERRKLKRQRRDSPRKWNDSNWAKLLTDERYRDPTTYEGKLFRSRFRVPYPKFMEICQKCRDSGEFNEAEKDCCNHFQ
jgi:hypothetical protein